MEKIFSLFNREIVIDDAKNMYYSILHFCTKLSNGLAKQYMELYYEHINGSADLIEKTIPLAIKVIQPAVKSILDYYCQNGIYDVDYDEITNEIIKTDSFYSTYEKIINKIKAINDAAAREKYERELMHSNRSTWSGGGFGIKGALKGAAIAGVLNAGSAISHGIAQSIGDMNTNAERADRLCALYSSNRTVSELAIGLEDAVANYFLIMGKRFEENGVAIKWIYKSETEKAKKMFSNINNSVLSIEQKKDILYKAFSLNPTIVDLYEYIFENYDIEEKRVACQMADYFNVNIDKLISRHVINDKKIQEISDSITLIEVKQIQKDIKDSLKCLGVNECSLIEAFSELEYSVSGAEVSRRISEADDSRQLELLTKEINNSSFKDEDKEELNGL